MVYVMLRRPLTFLTVWYRYPTMTLDRVEVFAIDCLGRLLSHKRCVHHVVLVHMLSGTSEEQ